VSRVVSEKETYLAETHIHEREATGNAYQYSLAAWTEVITPQATKFSYTRQYSNQFGPMEYNCGVQLPLQA
jgi:hypothetical protein